MAASQGAGEWVIYTNADIAVQPHFYLSLKNRIDAGARCFSVNRRTLANTYRGPQDLLTMYSDPGSPHCGHDCFVFPRSWIPNLELGTSCIAACQFDLLLIANLDAISAGRFEILREEMLTFRSRYPRAGVWMLGIVCVAFNAYMIYKLVRMPVLPFHLFV